MLNSWFLDVQSQNIFTDTFSWNWISSSIPSWKFQADQKLASVSTNIFVSTILNELELLNY